VARWTAPEFESMIASLGYNGVTLCIPFSRRTGEGAEGG